MLNSGLQVFYSGFPEICVSESSLLQTELLLQRLGQIELIETHAHYVLADHFYYAMQVERNKLTDLLHESKQQRASLVKQRLNDKYDRPIRMCLWFPKEQ